MGRNSATIASPTIHGASLLASRPRAYAFTSRNDARNGSTDRSAQYASHAATSRRYAARVCSDNRRLANHASVTCSAAPNVSRPESAR